MNVSLATLALPDWGRVARQLTRIRTLVVSAIACSQEVIAEGWLFAGGARLGGHFNPMRD
jgi:hypothetical protein